MRIKVKTFQKIGKYLSELEEEIENFFFYKEVKKEDIISIKQSLCYNDFVKEHIDYNYNL